MKAALGYTRISVDDESSTSLDYQEAAIREYCEKQGLSLVRIETDDGISGKSIKARPAVQRVLQAVDSQGIEAVVVFKSDRMSRDGLESLKIEQLMRSRGVAYLSVTEGDLTGDSADDEFLSFIRAGLNQRERKVIGIRTKAALQRKKDKGERLGRPRYGWKVVAGELVEDVEQQAIIRRVRALREKGFSFERITKALAVEGITNPKNKPFATTAIVRILKAA